MTKYLVLACIVAAIGCGDVTAELGPDGGAAGAGGAGGAGGAAAGGATGVDAGDAGGADGGTRPLAAGCVDDSQCSSGICGKASSTDTAGSCCNGRPDACNTCVGGYLTPAQDGTSAGLCTQCESGKATNLADGTLCGTDTSGARPPSCSGLIGSDYRCAAGACAQAVRIDCSNSGMFACTSTNESGCGAPTPFCDATNAGGTAATAASVQCFCGGSIACNN